MVSVAAFLMAILPTLKRMPYLHTLWLDPGQALTDVETSAMLMGFACGLAPGPDAQRCALRCVQLQEGDDSALELCNEVLAAQGCASQLILLKLCCLLGSGVSEDFAGTDILAVMQCSAPQQLPGRHILLPLHTLAGAVLCSMSQCILATCLRL